VGQKIGRYIILTLAALAVGFGTGWFWGHASGRQEMTLEAVKQNHGHYRIMDEMGHTVFEWGAGPQAPPK
jgi:pyrrolidone-carboxylate peptidase